MSRPSSVRPPSRRPSRRAARPLAALLVAPLVALLTAGLVSVTAPAASAHEERTSTFPKGTGEVPRFLGYDNARSRVVCRPETRALVADMRAGAVKDRNQRMLRRCEFGSIQDAINTISARNTSIYVLPGTYRETKYAGDERSDYCSNLETESNDPLDEVDYIGSVPDPEGEEGEDSDPIALSYSDQRRCAHNLNLIALFGDETPRNDSIACDSRFCGTQIVGTGQRRTDVLIDNRFSKLNALRADRMSGLYLSNFAVQQAEFNAVYVMESDGFVIDRLLTRGNDEYGILAFASDHGVIKHSEAYYNGDSGIYPGSASDVNGENDRFRPKRYSIEIFGNRSHHNTLGYSGTAGNSVYSHHNRFYKNATGISTDSLFPGHPGLPQDHARWSRNKIYSNNVNYFTKYVDTGVCAKPMPERGYLQGTVCPVVPVPVGTGVLIAGGNFNSTDNNEIYDNWRYGTMQFWVPAPLRDEFDPAKLYDTSHGNRTFGNEMGFGPRGQKLYNGMDHWWDDEGQGNCWVNNTSSRGEPTDNFLVDPGPCAEGGSFNSPGTAAVKDAGFLSCSQYDRNDPTLRHPPECNWFDSPPKPTATSGDPFPIVPGSGEIAPRSSTVGGPDVGWATSLLALGALLAVGAASRARRTARG
ncbi:hypothetical protein G7072_12750 [Nocardioides sp. HDW12B]|uniref:right-handed parallel beta-helix repeat-containing protein n=1 Tax=Nocardioides sp. HDW12B TaxID=2714939 RepID=UPI0014099C3B|nr:right-handed parallel beta-helix repeat-containing protein [Nocardioides sp. HDW12B]QIK67098.1 hypothetical protein G7072_12750 [Nocardioides sp. HDW12B]